MAKRPTINTLANTASPSYLTQLNQNFTNIRDQFDNTLSLDGSTPNAMNADLDLNGNDLINASGVFTDRLIINGLQVDAASIAESLNYATRAAFVVDNAANPGLGLSDGQIAVVAGLFYKRLSSATMIDDLAGWVPHGDATPEHFNAPANGTDDDRAAFIRAEASGLAPIVLTGTYFLSSNTGSTGAVYEIRGNATVTMGTGTFQPARQTDEKAKTYKFKYNFAATNPVNTGEPVVYSFIDSAHLDQQYLLNAWGRQNMVDQQSGSRTAVNMQQYRLVHAGEGDGYCTYWTASLSAHPRIGLTTHFSGQSSGGLGGGSTGTTTGKVNLYGFGDVVVRDNGYADTAMYNYVGIVYFDGTDSGDYDTPKLGCFQLSNGANAIDANFLAGGPTNIAFDATKADVTWGAFAMKSGQSILFDATEAAPGAGKFAATAAGSYTLSKPSGVNAFLFTRGADDVHLLRVAGSSASARAAVGSAGTVAYFSAHTTASENTTLSLRTANAGTMADRVTISSGGNLNVATAGARLQMGGVSVLNARQTGWTAATGTATRTTFATSTVTTAELAERVKALIDDLITHGLIGA